MAELQCPTCGALVEFRFDDSLVRICGSCRAAVLRSDRGVESLGTVADLMPIESPLRLFAEGVYNGESFLLVGMAQMRHGAGGVWQEWYAKFGGGTWGWLAEAQGRLYMTFEQEGPPPTGDLEPGGTLAIQGERFTVSERGIAAYISAAGEIPYRLEPGVQFVFSDLGNGRGAFATVDLGDPRGGDEPVLYLGRQVALNELKLVGGEDLRPGGSAAPAQAKKLACPQCGGALEMRVPDETLRIGCPYCASLVDVSSGDLSVISRHAKKPALVIPLGSKGTLAEGEMTVVGYLQRSAEIEGTWYPFEEYLLHAPSIGFRWVVCSDGHWSYVQPVQPGAVQSSHYQGVLFKAFQVAALRVDVVLGEMYWKVHQNEMARGFDYIHPPAMLSQEQSSMEVTWSLSTYLSRKQLLAAFPAIDKAKLPAPVGVAPNQPFPLAGIGKVGALLVALILAMGVIFAVTAKNKTITSENFSVAARTAGEAAPADIHFTQPFTLEAGQNVEVTIDASLDNQWAYSAVDLVNEYTGAVLSWDSSLEFYSGVDGGESWTEGSRSTSRVLAPVDAGSYILRFEAQHGSPYVMAFTATVKQDVFRFSRFASALGTIVFFLLFAAVYALWFTSRRMQNSSFNSSGDD